MFHLGDSWVRGADATEGFDFCLLSEREDRPWIRRTIQRLIITSNCSRLTISFFSLSSSNPENAMRNPPSFLPKRPSLREDPVVCVFARAERLNIVAIYDESVVICGLRHEAIRLRKLFDPSR